MRRTFYCSNFLRILTAALIFISRFWGLNQVSWRILSKPVVTLSMLTSLMLGDAFAAEADGLLDSSDVVPRPSLIQTRQRVPDIDTFVGLQMHTILYPILYTTVRPVLLEVFHSLPIDAPMSYTFFGKTIEMHMRDFRAAMSNVLNAGMIPDQKSLVDFALADVPKHKYTSGFFSACKILSAGMNGADTSRVIHSVSEVPEDQYQIFTIICRSMNDGMDPHDQSQMVRALAKAPSDVHKAIYACFTHTQVSEDMDTLTKIQLIGILAAVPADKYIPEFVLTYIDLCAGKSGAEKLSIMRDYTKKVRYRL